MITSVSVVPEFQRRGYGGRITSAVTRRILERRSPDERRL
ncbi:MAG: GNAT family N-acetyltransferase [Flavonifractor plautii]